MRLNALMVLAAAGAASGQTMTWMHDVPEDTVLAVGDSIKVTMSVAMESGGPPFVAIAAGIFDTLNMAGSEFGSIQSWEVLNDLDELTGDLTSTDGDSLFHTNCGQLTVFGPFTSDNPVDVLSFTWTADEGGGGLVEFMTMTSDAVVWVGDDKDSAVAVDAQGFEMSFGWAVIPSPGAAAVVGLGGLCLLRRRR